MSSYFAKNRGKSDDSEHQPHSESPTKSDRPARPERESKPDRESRPSRSPRTDKPYKTDRPYKSDRSFGSDRPYKSDKPFGSDRPYKSDKPFGSDRPYKSDKPFGSDRPYQSESWRDKSPRRFDSKPRFKSSDRPAFPRSNEEQTPEAELIFGIRPIIEAIESGKEIDKVLISRDTEGELAKDLKILLRDRDIPFQMVPVEKLNRVTRKNHQGVLAYISPIEYAKLENVLTATFEKGEVPLILILDKITDVRNFGAIVRSAECAGAHAIVVPSKGAAQINADALKTSAGALHLVPISRVNSLFQIIKYLQDSGLKVVASTEKATRSVYEADLKVPTAIILGSEDEGIEQELIDAADEACMIPLHGKIKSLNVSVAASVMLYEAVRQRLS